MRCPNCSHEWTPTSSELAAEMGRKGGSARSRKKTRASRANAKLGGWPKGKKRGKRKKMDANQLAHQTVKRAIAFTRDKLMPLTQQGRPPQPLKVLPDPKSPKRGR